MTNVVSTSDDRTVNDTLRHKYRVLDDDEKAQMQAVKDKGQEFIGLIDSLRSPEVQIGPDEETIEGFPMMCRTFDRELAITTERVEEAVMWAVKHITA